MPAPKLNGPHELTYDRVDSLIDKPSPGVFTLGYRGPGNVFYVNFVGRSDQDLRGRLLELIGSDSMFKFGTAATAEAAFHAECELFHSLRPPGNRIHPGRPPETSWACPRCGLLDRWR